MACGFSRCIHHRERQNSSERWGNRSGIGAEVAKARLSGYAVEVRN